MKAAQAPNHAQRAALIKLIHVARRELRYDEPTYRQVLQTAGGADSTSKMSVPALMRVRDAFKAAGFKVKARPAAQPRTLEINPEASKVRALWLFLHALGEVRDPSEAALARYVRRIARVDDLRWVGDKGATLLIETLKKWAMRVLPAEVARLRDEVAALHRTVPLTPEQIDQAMTAEAYLRGAEGFDDHWMAWERLMAVLGRPGPAQAVRSEAAQA